MRCMQASLEHLGLACPQAEVSLVGDGLLPRLTRLAVVNASRLLVDAALPALRELATHQCDNIRLGGERLQLPQCTMLHIGDRGAGSTAEVEFARLPALVRLSVDSVQQFTGTAYAAAAWLEQLDLGAGPPGCPAAPQLLREAPPSLCRLRILATSEVSRDAFLDSLQLTRMPQLTRLICNFGRGVPCATVIPRLASLHQLRELQLLHTSAADLSSSSQLEVLADLGSLCKLALGERFAEGEPRRLRMQVGCWRARLPVSSCGLGRGRMAVVRG